MPFYVHAGGQITENTPQTFLFRATMSAEKAGESMIIDSKGMRQLEASSGFTNAQLMEKAGKACAQWISQHMPSCHHILILCGKGNNGGDGFVIARSLPSDCDISAACVDGMPVSKEARDAMDVLHDTSCVLLQDPNEILKALDHADLVVDCVYGTGFHGALNAHMKKLFARVNAMHLHVCSIDINSGAEADSGRYDPDAIHSDVTIALDCYKPFHMLRKDHHLFQQACIVSLDIPHPDHSPFLEMDEERFFAGYPKKKENAYKGTFGKTTIIGGSYGMAGAMGMNIIGAKTVGVSYLNAVCPHEIYPIVASHFLTPVFHPFGEQDMYQVIEPLLYDTKAIAFGSGAVNMPKKEEILDLVLQAADCPVVLDAEAIRLLNHNYYVLRFVHEPVILTPHIGEFSALINRPVDVIQHDRIHLAQQFAKEYKVFLVLKGPHTIVASPTGDLYINQSGNSGLAQAGSGDLLTGMMAGLLTMNNDVFQAVCMAVWLHGYLAEMGTEDHAANMLDLSRFPALADRLYFRHNY
jgi:hydroxyethylthiazole kinase-like uncharacterized protein yjeF